MATNSSSTCHSEPHSNGIMIISSISSKIVSSLTPFWVRLPPSHEHTQINQTSGLEKLYYSRDKHSTPVKQRAKLREKKTTFCILGYFKNEKKIIYKLNVFNSAEFNIYKLAWLAGWLVSFARFKWYLIFRTWRIQTHSSTNWHGMQCNIHTHTKTPALLM